MAQFKSHILLRIPGVQQVNGMFLMARPPHSPQPQRKIAVLGDSHPVLDDFHRVVGKLFIFIPGNHYGHFCPDTVNPVDIDILHRDSGFIRNRRIVHQRSHLLVAEGGFLHVYRIEPGGIIQLQQYGFVALGTDSDQCGRLPEVVVVIIVRIA